jgi:hypothetical protein
VLARAVRGEQPPPTAAQIEVSVDAFLDHAIGKMVTICRAVTVARGK